jgi:hypothetical protein
LHQRALFDPVIDDIDRPIDDREEVKLIYTWEVIYDTGK